MGCFVVAWFVLTSVSRGPCAIAELVVFIVLTLLSLYHCWNEGGTRVVTCCLPHCLFVKFVTSWLVFGNQSVQYNKLEAAVLQKKLSQTFKVSLCGLDFFVIDSLILLPMYLQKLLNWVSLLPEGRQFHNFTVLSCDPHCILFWQNHFLHPTCQLCRLACFCA